MEIIKSKDVYFTYEYKDAEENVEALKNINLTINQGEFVAILGHNGSGKSTFAKLLNALLIPTKGTVIIKGFDSKDENNTWDIRRNCGMVFQNPDNQIIATIVEEDVAFGLENLSVPSKEIRERVDSAIKTVGMEEYQTKSAAFLSGGQKQRVAIAGVLAMKPDCIVFDESTAMLDPIGRKEVLDTILNLNKNENITIVLITHYMEEAVLADRVFVMNNGEIELSGTPREVFKNVKHLKSISLDVPQITELSFNLKNLGIEIKDDILSIEEMTEAICNYNLKT